MPRDLRNPQAMFQDAPSDAALPIAHRARSPTRDPPTTERTPGARAPCLQCPVGDPGGLRTYLNRLPRPKYPISESSSRPLIGIRSAKTIIDKVSKTSTTGAQCYRKSCARPKTQFGRLNSQIARSHATPGETPHLVNPIDTILTQDVNGPHPEPSARRAMKNHRMPQRLIHLLTRRLETQPSRVRQA